MEDHYLSLKHSRKGAVVVSFIVAFVSILILAQGIFAAGSANISASDGTDIAQDGEVITSTVVPDYGTPLNMEAEDLFGEYLRAHTTYSQDGVHSGTAVADLSGSTKTVDFESALAGSPLNYTIVISNNDTVAANDLVVTDSLPAALSYHNNSYQSTVVNGFTASEFDGMSPNGVITWTGSLGPHGYATLSFRATLTDSLAVDDVVTNTVEIDNGSMVITRQATTTIVDQPSAQYAFMPVLFKALNAPVLQVSRPNSQNQWTVFWADSNPGGTVYEIQESHSPDFSTILDTRSVAGSTSSLYQRALSTENEYYYRVRASRDDYTSLWSNVVHVIGGYYDDFSDNTTGWAIRRTTYLEEVRSWYERNGDEYWFIMQVEDSWDWGIAAPYKKRAPEVPYAIEYRSKIAHVANLVSHGAAFGADWPGETCPDYDSFNGLYRHQICFNHFYDTNTIWFNHLKLLFERVDYLEWRPQDGGSPMKRGSFDDFDSWFEVSSIPNVDADGWNTFRIEVRENSLKLFANGAEYYNTANNSNFENIWANEPYFGVFGSTDEYSNSTTRFDYYKVTPLDN